MAILDKLRPKELEQECDRLMEIDRKSINKDLLITVNCIACGSGNRLYSFTKYNFTYNKCADCSTLYLSPRSSQEDLSKFFEDSKAMNFWAETIYPATISYRRLIFKKRANRLKKVLKKHNFVIPVSKMLEIGPGFGLFLEQAKKLNFSKFVSCIEPSLPCCLRIKSDSLADSVYQMTLDKFHSDQKFDLIVCNGVIEHPFSVVDFLGKMKIILDKNGLIIISSAGSDGLDTNGLLEKTPNVEPPQVQNFISFTGWQHLSKELGFQIVDYQSEGQLDSELFYNEIYQSDQNQLKAMAGLLANLKLRHDFQKILQKYRLTGFYTVILSIA